MLRLQLVLMVMGLLLQNAFADPLWVAVGYGGRRLSSHDGVNWGNDQRWSEEARDDDNTLFGIAYGKPGERKDGIFVAVGGGASIGHILITQDGVAWKELPQRKGRVATIAFGAGRFVAGHDGELLYSVDGETFDAGQRLDWKGSVHARKSAFGDGEGGNMFVIIGDVDFFGEKERVSWRAATADGKSFAKAEHHTSPARDIAFGAGHFVIVGAKGLIESSHDGFTWMPQTSDPNEDFQDVIWTGTRFIARGKETWSSGDGMTWTRELKPIPCEITWASEPTSTANLKGIGISWGGNIHSSPDLMTWSKSKVVPGPSLTAIALGER